MVCCSGKPVSSSIHFYPTALKGFGVLFSPMASGWAGGRAAGKTCLGHISNSIRCRLFIFGMDIG